ncbi:MAG: YkgJ family cysteine cluster protein [Candidatus Bathyarchaeota archaeon]|nr:YkgJ family cysteine cluster protein [Candidatus Bathyarchaeum tardum]WGM90043.1 MAG: YkgJ family cysteine cluster protein [Candidatus Bathyarchaeum tardum]WNZ29815.1 MAG: YkgJ family cysteine cluster protein [Candidatus Bathyarchaeota archaeon]
MRCSNCGICCEQTMMELSSNDVHQLNVKGYHLEEFAVIDKYGIRLRNVDGYCYFYSRTKKRCKIYENRPLGCYIYPVMHVTNEGVAMIDESCPRGKSVSKKELRTKEKILDKLLKKIDNEILHIDPRTYTPI